MAKKPVVEVLFPEFGNLAGDNGNADYLRACLPNSEFLFTPSQETPAFVTRNVDCVLMSNMMESQQERALEHLRPFADRLGELADEGVCMLFTGAAAEILGNSFQTMDGRTLEGLGLFDFAHTQLMPKRFLSAFSGVFEAPCESGDTESIRILGFHAQFTQLEADNSHSYFARATRGWGINTQTILEGFRRANCIATTLLGPLLPTNPDFAAWFLERVANQKLPLAFEKTARRAFERRAAEFDAAPQGKEIEF